MFCATPVQGEGGILSEAAAPSSEMKSRPLEKDEKKKLPLCPPSNPFTVINELIFHCNRELVQQHAIYSAYLSILAGVGEFYLSVAAGEDDDSNSIFGIASMAFIEAAGSSLVVWRWQCSSPSLKPSSLSKIEARCSICIGFGMLFTVAMLLSSSFNSLMLHDTPDGEKEAFAVSCYTAAVSLFLFLYKYHIGKILNSMVVISDARSSLCAGLVALAVIVSEFFQQYIWCADDLMGILLSFYILFQAFNVIGEGWNELKDLSDKNHASGEKDTLLGAPYQSNV